MFATFDFIPVNFIEFLIPFYICICYFILFSSIIGDKKAQIVKWSLISLLKISVLKLVSTRQFVMIWSVAAAVLLVTLVRLFIIGVILFWYNKFRKFCTFFQLSWSNTLRLKSPAIWNFLFDFFVLFYERCNSETFQRVLSILLVAYIKH